MVNKKLVITQNLSETLSKQISNVIPDWELIIGRDKEIWHQHILDADVIAGWKKDMKDLITESSNKLQWIQTWSAGVNSLPLRQLEEKKIQLTSANGVHSYPISETIYALMLALTRKIHTYVKNQQSKTWHHSNMKLEMHEKTIGIIGVGAIGKETAKIAKAFGMHVLGVRHSGHPTEYVDEMYTPDQLDQLLPKCDYVVVTLPLTNETKHMITSKQFSLMKPSSYFINIGRGEIVIESDLINALKTHQIAGAGLDVFTTEPLPKDNPLWEMDNVIVTPHTSGSTEFYDKRVVEEIFIPNLKQYIEGQPLSINVVDYKKGY
ncbi:D-2-hydroxyacid dehydrogenase [Halalkalibacter krulwichiae]|uniref:Glyoxylate/hydroxypyruvate reductase B n=1 Tax=Halalkalibacter krulwichiae TaxID=199441 RepID=A0A1X9M7W5_9BACI|nr:D-2-hydroxyacid dehydrogenase [Halalkalibacter krulwichiae]ARK29506.1 Glyoxylate/hydroxypyruvate reductase B [Halalkalibacter krulwichiae]